MRRSLIAAVGLALVFAGVLLVAIGNPTRPIAVAPSASTTASATAPVKVA
jgi:hypothetical protein